MKSEFDILEYIYAYGLVVKDLEYLILSAEKEGKAPVADELEELRHKIQMRMRTLAEMYNKGEHSQFGVRNV